MQCPCPCGAQASTAQHRIVRTKPNRTEPNQSEPKKRLNLQFQSEQQQINQYSSCLSIPSHHSARLCRTWLSVNHCSQQAPCDRFASLFICLGRCPRVCEPFPSRTWPGSAISRRPRVHSCDRQDRSLIPLISNEYSAIPTDSR